MSQEKEVAKYMKLSFNKETNKWIWEDTFILVDLEKLNLNKESPARFLLNQSFK